MTKLVLSRFKTGVALAAIAAQLAMTPANAFCGFYVAKADSKLFNKSSKVVLARNGEALGLLELPVPGRHNAKNAAAAAALAAVSAGRMISGSAAAGSGSTAAGSGGGSRAGLNGV